MISERAVIEAIIAKLRKDDKQWQTYNLLGFNVILCFHSGVGPVVMVLSNIILKISAGSRTFFYPVEI